MIIELPNYIDQKTIDEIRNSVKPYINKSNSTTEYRDGNSVFISQIPELKEIDFKLFNIFSNLQENVVKQRYNPLFTSGDSGYEYHIYNPGEICHYHSDGEVTGKSLDNNVLRYASVCVHLNTVKEGGELVFPSQNRSIKTEAGKVVIFPPYGMYSHYTTASLEPREVLVTWFIYSNLKIVYN
jgi:hypothetical protein